MVASKKNGGVGGSRFFDGALVLDEPAALALPEVIPADGKAGNGQELYVLLNGEIDCAWYSARDSQYQGYRCFEGATRNGGTSSGKDTVTTARATFVKQ